MKREDLTDLKQFIAATVSQSEARMTYWFNVRFNELNRQMEDGFEGVGDALGIIHVFMEKQEAINRRTNKRLKVPEARPAGNG